MTDEYVADEPLAEESVADESFSTLFAHALQGNPCHVVGLDPEPSPLPIADWTREADADDHILLRLCQGPTIDIGCGPGRLTAALADAGHVALGIDVVLEAVGQTRDRGAPALLRDVFDSLPGEGRWQTALLADGNVGIGGDPVALLKRARDLIDPRGRVVVEVHPPGTELKTVWALLECNGIRSRPFRWSIVGVGDIGHIAAEAGLRVAETIELEERWYVVLAEAT